MLGRNRSEPALFQMVDLEALVPEGHLLRKLDAVLDLSFVHDEVAACYNERGGRPSVDPELALRMMLLAELYDLSDRQLCDEIRMHAGMRWFLGLNFHDPVPDHSTLSRLRNERWAESGLFERLRDEVLRQCAEAGLVSGRHLSVDGTVVEADASMKSMRPIGPRAVDERAPAQGAPPDPPGSGSGGGGSAKPAEPQPAGAWRGHGERFSNATHRSTTDPDARLYRKGDNRGARLSYLVHDLIDTKSRVVLRRRASLATSTAEREVALEMVDDVLETKDVITLPKDPEILTGDANYGAGAFVADVLERGLGPHVPLLAGDAMEELPTWMRRTTNLEHLRKRKEKVRIARARNRVRALHRTRGYTVSRKLRIRSEHVFAEAKGRHGLGRARRRGLEKLQVQAELSAVVQNLKRLAAHGSRRGRTAAAAALERSRQASSSAVRRLFGWAHHLHSTLRSHARRFRLGAVALGRVSTAANPISSTAF